MNQSNMLTNYGGSGGVGGWGGPLFQQPMVYHGDSRQHWQGGGALHYDPSTTSPRGHRAEKRKESAQHRRAEEPEATPLYARRGDTGRQRLPEHMRESEHVEENFHGEGEEAEDGAYDEEEGDYSDHPASPPPQNAHVSRAAASSSTRVSSGVSSGDRGRGVPAAAASSNSNVNFYDGDGRRIISTVGRGRGRGRAPGRSSRTGTAAGRGRGSLAR